MKSRQKTAFKKTATAKLILKQFGFKNFLEAINALAFCIERLKELDRVKNNFPEPYKTIVSDILICGKSELMPGGKEE